MYVMVRLFVTLTFLSEDEILRCYHSNETYTIWQNFSIGLFFLTFLRNLQVKI